jgi:hypothetical protein
MGAGTGTMTGDQYRHQVNRRLASLTAAPRHAAQIGREEQLCRCEINNQGINPLGVAGTVLRTGGGVLVRQAQNLAALPGAAMDLAWATPGAIVAAPGAIADIARDPGGSWDRASTSAIVGFRDWVVNTRADILSGDPDRMASGITASIDVATAFTGVAGAGKAVSARAGANASRSAARDAVHRAVQDASSLSLDDALGMGALSHRQTAQLLGNPTTSPMFAGHLVHNITPDLLAVRFPGRFVYRPSLGADILDTVTGMQFEVATWAQQGVKAAKYPHAGVVPYRWSP